MVLARRPFGRPPRKARRPGSREVDLHRSSVEESFLRLRSSREGLGDDEVRRRLREHGRNEITKLERPHAARALLEELFNFFAIILWVAAGLAYFVARRDPGSGMGTLASAIIAVIAVNGAFSYWQRHRAEKALDALERLLPPRARVTRSGAVMDVDAAELVPGDLLHLSAGDRVPADGRVVESFGLTVDTSTLTGESVPLSLDAKPSAVAEIAQARNQVFAGTAIGGGHGLALVIATGKDTRFASLAHLAQTTRSGPTPLEREIARVSRMVALLATLLGVAFAGIGLWKGDSEIQAILFGIGIIVANVPEGLLPTVTLALAMAARRMAKRNALVRHLPAVEALGAATVIVTDKTGTLTENRMRVTWAHAFESAGSFGEARPIEAMGSEARLLLEACLICENVESRGSRVGGGKVGDPTELALVELAESRIGALESEALRRCRPRVDEIPFDADRRRLTTIHQTPEGLVLYAKGAPEVMLTLANRVRLASGEVLIDSAITAALEASAMSMAGRGLRVLAVGRRELDRPFDGVEGGLTLLGLVGLSDPPRPEVPRAVASCRSAGIRVIMATGDHPQTALAVARAIGLSNGAQPRVITGRELEAMADSELTLELGQPDLVLARLDASQKTRVVRLLRRKGEVVAVTGDGVNDAPALRAADIGVAMGRSGTDVARESADIVLADDNFASLAFAIEEGRAVYANIEKFLTYILTSNVPEVIPYLAFMLFRIPLPLTIVQILAVDLGTDLVPALALGAEPPSPELMSRPPRSRDARLLSGRLLFRAYGALGLVEAAAAMTAFFLVLAHGQHGRGTLSTTDPLYLRATTACLVAIVVCQVANLFVCRRPIDVFGKLHSSPSLLIAGAIAVELLVTAFVVLSPPGQEMFGTAPLHGREWLIGVPFAISLFPIDFIVRRIVRGKTAP
ncbi:MAG: cation-transporting P-type ATPase [Deltaproteobacteria bacterium]|nr:cation-transporting P-type ATPase [Deltaproteobacteria bacterium]